jgi:hypothetical protein
MNGRRRWRNDQGMEEEDEKIETKFIADGALLDLVDM